MLVTIVLISFNSSAELSIGGLTMIYTFVGGSSIGTYSDMNGLWSFYEALPVNQVVLVSLRTAITNH